MNEMRRNIEEALGVHTWEDADMDRGRWRQIVGAAWTWRCLGLGPQEQSVFTQKLYTKI